MQPRSSAAGLKERPKKQMVTEVQDAVGGGAPLDKLSSRAQSIKQPKAAIVKSESVVYRTPLN